MADKDYLLSDIEQKFVDHYVVYLRKDLAAMAAGISRKTAKQQGYQIYNRLHVREAIEQILKEHTLNAAENLKGISDIATANLLDFYRPEQRVYILKITVGLQVIIDRLAEEIKFEQLQYTGLNDLKDTKIFEGDVLRESAVGIFEVVWSKRSAKFKLDWERVSPTTQYPEWNRGLLMDVIGNVYQNPELLIRKTNE